MFKNIFKRKKRTLILGIHGLSNKPPKRILKKWWRKSIEEGLAKIDGRPTKFDFKMVYWADILYKEPLGIHIKDSENPLFIDEPYFSEKELKKPKEKSYWQSVKNIIQYIKEVVFLSRIGLNKFRRPFDFIVKFSFNDLDVYYNEEVPKNEQIRGDLFKTRVRRRFLRALLKNRKKDIFIVAHSMGSIITYDVLQKLNGKLKIKGLISVGSPLGLPLIRENIMKDHGIEFEEEASPPTPEGLENWYSFTDKEDNIAVFYNLNEFYKPNSIGTKPIGKLVDNDYKNWITDNAHKSFGYLRTPEVAQVLSDFLSEGRTSLLVKGRRLLNKITKGKKKP